MSHPLETLLESLDETVTVEDGQVVVKDEAGLRGEPIDRLVHTAVFGSLRERGAARWLLWELGQALGIYSTTIHPLYIARGKGEVPGGFTVPAMNL
ncbi:MAG: aldolase, partial [Chloroflexi bacterium]